MNDNFLVGCIGNILIYAPNVLSAYFIWQWVSPTGFWSFLLFLLVWGLIGSTISGIISWIIKFILTLLFRR